MERMKVIRVTEDEFELSDGQVIPHVSKLDVVPTLEEFQAYLDEWYAKLVPLSEQEPKVEAATKGPEAK